MKKKTNACTIKNIISFAMIFCLLVTLGACNNTSDSTDVGNGEDNDITQIGEDYVNALLSNQFEEAYNNYPHAKAMADAMNPKAYEQTMISINELTGKIVTIHPSIRTEEDEYILISVPVEGEKENINLNVYFDKNNDIAGLRIADYKTDNKAEDTEPAHQGSADIAQIGEDYVNALLNNQYEEAYNNYLHDKTMAETMSPKAYEQAMVSINEQIGEVLKVYPSIKSEANEYIVVSVPVEGKKSNTNLDVYFNENNEIVGLHLSAFNTGEQAEAESLPDDIIEKSILLSSGDYELDGMLTLPKEGDDFPVVIIAAGSGPTDKDGTIGANKVYRSLSWQLASQGIATYRFDKITYSYGEELSKNLNFTIYDEYVNDIISATELVADIPEVDKSNIYVLGHSLGGHLIPLISENVDVNGYIIMAGNVSGIEELITKQYEYLFNLDGQISQDEQIILDNHNAELEKLSDLDNLSDDEVIIGGYKAYWESLNSYSPLESAKAINNPVLVLQGKRDYQVTMDEYNLWYNEFSNSENWRFKTFENLNHLMMEGSGVPSPNEYSVKGDVDKNVINDIVNWIISN